jgi:hypothetical protein
MGAIKVLIEKFAEKKRKKTLYLDVGLPQAW